MKRTSLFRSKHAWSRSMLLEGLESRVLLDGTPLFPLADSNTATNHIAVESDAQSSPGSTWLTPAQFRNWYGFNSIAFSNGTITGDGSGQTIAIIDWGNDAKIATNLGNATNNDLNAFDSQYSIPGGLASNFLTVYAQSSADSAFHLASTISSANLPTDARLQSPASDAEIALDVEWAHAFAPGAKIDLIEAQNAQFPNLTAAITYAKNPSNIPGVTVVSMSFGANDSSSPFSDSLFSQAGVSFVASSGDNGSFDSPFVYSGPELQWQAQGTGIIQRNDDYTPYPTAIASTSQNFVVIAAPYGVSGNLSAGEGITIRADVTNPSSPAYSVLSTYGGGDVVWRSTANTTSSSSPFALDAAFPGCLLVIQRIGSTYYSWDSSDNAQTWQAGPTETISALSGNVTIQLFGYDGSDTVSQTDSCNIIELEGGSTVTNAPASSVNVVGVGGTLLAGASSGNITGETQAWGNGNLSYNPGPPISPAQFPGGSGGGYSATESRPAYQNAVSSNAGRGVPDVSFAYGPVGIYDTDTGTPSLPWIQVTGTSFSAPAWAALITVADQGRAIAGLTPLGSIQTLDDLYGFSNTTFRDITTGSNGANAAGVGYDAVTGLGSPHATNVVAGFASEVANAGFEATTLAPSSSVITDWTVTGNATVSNSTIRSGSYAGKLTSNASQIASLSQTLTDLKPNTTYQLSGWSNATSSSSIGMLSISGYGGLTLTSSSNSTLWSDQILTFTTGPGVTSATITLSEALGTAGSVFFDDVSLTPVSKVNNLDFETGDLTDWTHGSGANVTTAAPHTGSYAAKVANGSSLSTVINGLQANTTYTVSFYGKVDSGNATFAASGFSGSATSNVTISNSAYSGLPATLTFTTGASPASVTLTLTSATANSSNFAYFDDINVAQGYTFNTTLGANVTITQDSSNLTITDGTQTVQIPVSAPRPIVIASGSSNETITINQSGGAVTIPGDLGIYGTGNITLIVNAGFYAFNSDAGANASNLTIRASAIASLTFNSPQTLGGGLILDSNTSLSVTPGGKNTLFLGNLTLASNGTKPAATFILNNNKLIVEAAINHNATMTTIQSEAAYGKSNPYGIQDPAPVLPPNSGFAVIDNAIAGLTSFGGVTVDSNSVLVSQELLGDANIDGRVDLSDLSKVLNNFGVATTAWTSGNFDGAATIDLTDLSAVLNNFGLTNPNASDISDTQTGSGGGSDSPSGSNQTYTPTNSNITLTVCLSNNTLMVSDGTTTAYVPLADLNSFIVLSGTTNETVTVDQSTGNLPSGIEIDGTADTTLIISGGTYTFNNDAGVNASNLTVIATNGASLIFNASQHLGSLELNAGTTAALDNAGVTLMLGSISVDGSFGMSNGSIVASQTSISSTGNFTESGGSASLGALDDAGAINVSGGSLDDGSVWTWIESTGSFTQSGGNATLTYLDDYGSISLSGTASLIDSSNSSWIEDGATFDETAGYASLHGVVLLGAMNVSGGSYVSYTSNVSNAGTFDQSDGDVQIAYLNLVNGSSSIQPTYTLSGGTLGTINTTLNLWAIFDQSGGSSQVEQTLLVKNHSKYTLSNGSLEANFLSINACQFEQDAGELVAATIASSGTITLNNGNITAGDTSISGNGTVSQSNGTFTTDTLELVQSTTSFSLNGGEASLGDISGDGSVTVNNESTLYYDSISDTNTLTIN